MSGDIGLEQPIIFYHEEITEAKKIVLEHKGIKLAYLEINNKNNIKNFLELKNKLKPLCNNFVDFGNYFSENVELD